MKIILLKDIKKIGKKFDLKEVKDGFAMNFLIPKGLAKLANKKEIEKLNALKAKTKEVAEQSLEEEEKKASSLDGQELLFSVKTSEEGQLFEAINQVKIAKKLKEMGFEVKEKQVAIDKPFKSLGEFSATINLGHQLEAKISVIIEEEKMEEGLAKKSKTKNKSKGKNKGNSKNKGKSKTKTKSKKK